MNREEAELLLEVMRKRTPELVEVMFELAVDNTLERAEREQLCAAIGAEFAETGLDSEGEPSARGSRLEALLDILNRPNIRQ